MAGCHATAGRTHFAVLLATMVVPVAVGGVQRYIVLHLLVDQQSVSAFVAIVEAVVVGFAGRRRFEVFVGWWGCGELQLGDGLGQDKRPSETWNEDFSEKL
jgi:hypothetical protein